MSPAKIKPMLAKGMEADEALKLPAGDYIFETKYDGARILAFKDGSSQYLQARSGSNKTATLPEINVQTKLPAILDGEVIGFNNETFQDSVQHRINKQNNIAISAKLYPLKYVVFDVLEIDGKSVEQLPLEIRKDLLANLFIPTSTTELAPFTEDALTLWQDVVAKGLEGMVGKRKQGRYMRDARDWQKVKTWQRNYGLKSTGETFLVVGYTEGTGWRESTFGAMVLGRLEADGTLTYVGAVGTGVTSTSNGTVAKNIDDIQALMSMFVKVPFCPWPREPEPAIWVKPFAVKIQYLERSNDGLLRFPSFKGVV